MNVLKPLLVLLTLIFTAPTSLLATRKIPIGEREVLIKVYDLPDTEEFLLPDGHYLDLATLHREFNIAYVLPLWITKDAVLVGFDGVEESYYDIPENELDDILAKNNLDKASLLSIPFYNKYGGKIVALLLIIFILYPIFPKQKNKTKPQNT